MSFKKVFRGYDPEEVDKLIAETAAREKQIRTAQKERIDELTDENYALRQQLRQYKDNELAISQSLIASQQLAQELKNDAEKYSDLVLSRAKIFYATWHTYSKTLIATLSAEEVREFNKLQRKIEDIINAYDGQDVEQEVEENVARYESRQTAERKSIVDNFLQSDLENPIDKLQSASDQIIDLRELTQPEQSLEELCRDLGLLGLKR